MPRNVPSPNIPNIYRTLSSTQQNIFLLVPAGTVLSYAGVTVPNGYLICDGSEISRDVYSNLFATIGTVFGNGDGTTTFLIPDMRDRFLMGTGASFSLGETGGSHEVTLEVTNLPPHTHTGTTNDSSSGGAGTTNSEHGVDIDGSHNTVDVGTHSHTFTTDSTGSGTAFSVLNSYLGLYYIIRY